MPIFIDQKTYDNRYSHYRMGRHRSLLGGGWSTDDFSAGTYDPGQTSKNGYKDTDWKVKVSKQQDASHTYQRNRWLYAVPYFISMKGTCAMGSTPYATEMVRATNFATNQLSSSTDAALRDVAIGRLKKTLRESLGGYEATIPIIELRELRQTIRGTTDSMTKFVTSLLEARKTRGRSFVKYAQNSWLNWSFGVSPLISDTMAILNSLDTYFRRFDGVHRIHSKATKRWNTQYNSPLGDYGPAYGWYVDQYASVEHVLRYHVDAGIDFSVIYGNDYSLARHLGLEDFGQQLPSIGWELFPFSWVFDYVTTMGAYLEDTYELPAGSTKYLTLTRVYTAEGYELPSMRPSGRWTAHKWTESVKPGHWKYIMTQREVLSSLPHRALRVKSVDEIGRFAVNKLLNLSALLKFGRK